MDVIPKKEETAPRRDIKLLVVDDREDNLFSIETILERDGYTLVKAASGRAALKILLAQQDFTLILMDVQMPDMNGFETANLIYERDRLRHIPIIFITAHSHEADLVFKGYQMGGVDYIYKPINPDLLRAKVSVFTELAGKNHQLMVQERKLMAANRSLEKEVQERRLTEEKIRLLNRQLTENNTHLMQANEELNRFAYVASHDLQEPLRKIKLFSNTLVTKHAGRIDKDMDMYLQKIVQASERMQVLIRDLLEFSRQTNTDEDFVSTDLGAVLHEVLADMEPDLEAKKGIVSADPLPTVMAIRGQMYQLFQNLISNALKYSRPDVTPTIHVRSDVAGGPAVPGKTEQGRHHRISFQDNGIGFDPAYADDIFVVFKRLHSYHDVQGTGVGLAVCKKIVELHRGFIKAEGELNQGATFIVGLPAVETFVPAPTLASAISSERL